MQWHIRIYILSSMSFSVTARPMFPATSSLPLLKNFVFFYFFMIISFSLTLIWVACQGTPFFTRSKMFWSQLTFSVFCFSTPPTSSFPEWQESGALFWFDTTSRACFFLLTFHIRIALWRGIKDHLWESPKIPSALSRCASRFIYLPFMLKIRFHYGN